ncbi:NifU family protein [Streptomonospora litoralis]|uniref:Fe/S biogenesis protein NfuA n=1 Tax=Streptomonospora litoralis TaxID=2498135 RepID=A0A4P6Q3S2_9ACTN|nr:NifU family protein [Streptomonospora litoralis]QBI53549.1 Fe/S biogenesis protein NfuA [Streptomonospora litoralis]
MASESRLDRTSERVEQLLDELADADPAVGERAEEAVGLIVRLYGSALERIVGLAAEGADGSAEPGGTGAKAPLMRRMADDELLRGLLVLHDLHPEDTATRVEEALERVRPYLGSHAGDVELLEVGENEVRLRLRGNCEGCPSSAVTVKESIERVIAEAAPEIGEIRVDGMDEGPAEPDRGEAGFVPLDSVRHRPPEHAMTCTVPADLAADGPAAEAAAGERA